MNKMMPSLILFLMFLILGGLASNSALSQTDQGQDVLKHEVVVTLKLIQVQVVDGRGAPVTDLTKDDFILYDNGKLQTITDFEKYDLFAPGEKTESSPQDKMSTTPEFNRKFLLFFDMAFNTAQGIENAKQAALAFIGQQLLPTDEVGVLSYSSGKFLTQHELLTTDHKKVEEFLKGVGRKDLLGRAGSVGESLWDAKPLSGFSKGRDLAELEREALLTLTLQDLLRFEQNVLTYTDVMKELAQALSRIPGHKYILYLSTGIPASTVDHNFFDKIFSDRFEEMIRLLAASDSSVYPLYADPALGFADRLQTGKSTLQRLAAGTGGKYFGNIKNPEPALKEIQNASSAFYVLGYYIGTSWDGAYHELSVESKRKGCKIRAQIGYYNPKPFNELTPLERKLDFLELALEEKSHFLEPLRFPIQALPLTVEGLSGLLTLAKIPTDVVAYLSGKQVEISNLFFDEKNNLRLHTIWRVDFSNETIKDVFLYSLSSLPAGRYTSRLILRNMETGAAAVSSAPAAVEAPDGSGLRLSPPLLLIPEKEATYFKGSRLQGEDKSSKTIDLSDVYPFNFNDWAPIIEVMEQGTAGLTAVIRVQSPGTSGTPFPGLKIIPRLIDEASGETIPVPFSIIQKTPKNGSQIFYVSFPSEQLEPSKYVLQFDAQETETGVESTVQATLTISDSEAEVDDVAVADGIILAFQP